MELKRYWLLFIIVPILIITLVVWAGDAENLGILGITDRQALPQGSPSANEDYDIVEFASLPARQKTNIPAFPVTGRLPQETHNFYVNDVNTIFDPVGLDFFAVVDLQEGLNSVVIRGVNAEGKEVVYSSKEIEFDPNFLTGEKELIYANTRYVGPDNEEHEGVLVIDVEEGSFLGMIEDHKIRGISRDGSEIVLNGGMRYSTEDHSYTGRNLPIIVLDNNKLIYSHEDRFVYYDRVKVDLDSNLAVVPLLPKTIHRTGDISSNGNRIYLPYGFIDISTNVFVEKPYGSLAKELVVDPMEKYVFRSWYAYGSSLLEIRKVEDGNIEAEYGAGDYAGNIAFSTDGRTAYAGFFGNARYGKGEILIIDMDTFEHARFQLHGPRSLVVSEGGKIYASAFYTLLDNLIFRGQPELRGIIELVPDITDAASLKIGRVFFASLWSTMTIPYYDKDNIFHKPAKDLSQQRIQALIALKSDLVEQLNAAMYREQEVIDMLFELLVTGDYGDLTDDDLHAAKQRVEDAIQQQEQSKEALLRSIDYLKEALALLSSPTESQLLSDQ